MTSTNQIRNGAVRHIIFGFLTWLSLIASIIVTVLVLLSVAPLTLLWVWAVFGVFSILLAVNFLVLFFKASSEF